MATLKATNDGGFVILKGFPIKTKGEQVSGFATYKLLPRAESLFQESRFRDGCQIENYLFYLLIMDEMITNASIAKIKVTTDNFPAEFMKLVKSLASDKQLQETLANKRFLECKDLLDFYRLVRELNPQTKELQSIKTAAFLRLSALYRQQLMQS